MDHRETRQMDGTLIAESTWEQRTERPKTARTTASVSSRTRNNAPTVRRRGRKNHLNRRHSAPSEVAGAERVAGSRGAAFHAAEPAGAACDAAGCIGAATTIGPHRERGSARVWRCEWKSGSPSTEQRLRRILGLLERGLATFLQLSRAEQPQQLARRRWRTPAMTGASKRRSR